MAADESPARAEIRVRIEADESTGGPYDVLIRPGLSEDAGVIIPATVPSHRYAIVTDSNVAPLYGPGLVGTLADAGHAVDIVEFPAGEKSKTREIWARLTDQLIERGHGRDSCLIALGGGVVGDMAGFVAATYMRGIPFVNVPTTLLAMLDSAVGGKTGVDTPAGKNLVGSFHQPRLVLVDPSVLSTLAEKDYRASLAEAVKHAVILDAEYFDWIDRHTNEILARTPAVLAQLVHRSIEIKASVVATDTRETGRRAILNFGHTLGHALERASDFAVGHGQAVAIGMVLEARLGEDIGLTEAGTADRIARLLSAFGLPVDLTGTGVTGSAMTAATRSDKKVRGAIVHYAFPARIGRMRESDGGGWTTAVPDDATGRVTGSGGSAISQVGTEF